MIKNLEEFIYYKSPVWLQNVLLSLYGYSLYRKRYGELGFRNTVGMIRSLSQMSSDEIEALQLRSLKEMISNTYEHVPYYREVYSELHLHPSDIKKLSDIKMFPIIEKDMIQQHQDKFISDQYKKSDLEVIFTSGTSGKPLAVYCSRKALRINYAYFNFFKEQMGIGSFEKTVTFAGRIIVSADVNTPPFWRHNKWMNNVLFSSYHLSDQNIPFYIQKMNELKPVMIDSYPSAVFVIAKYALDNNMKINSPRAILTSSETLFDYQRNIIEEAFQSKVYDQYCSAEMVTNIFQCRNGSYHLYPGYGIAEFIDAHGNDVYDEPGEMICTGFINPAMPLVRYRIGDSGISSSKRCSCGSCMPVVEKIVGRIDNLLMTKDGKKIGRLDPIFKGLSSIRECQIYQKSDYNIILRVVKGKNYHIKETDILLKELRKRIGHEIDVSVEYVDSIQRTSNGKFPAVISEIK